MKTPDLIKKALEACGVLDGDCENCPYDDGPQLVCVDRLRKDAIAYIQQLESRLAQVERERDAAVYHLQLYARCKVCEHRGTNDGFCSFCVGANQFQWCGVCPENTKEP